MSDVIGIRFKRCGTIYDFEVNGEEIAFKRGDLVIIESELGLGIGSVVTERRTVEKPSEELKKIIRRATEEDIKKKQENESFEQEAKAYCLERINARGLPMKLISTEATLDRKRIIFYFTADGRIDFRELVKDLAAKFKTRIEMRQIGVRDEAKIVGGFGVCGRELCCNTFLMSFAPISIKMAKQQELVLNMNKLSGVCGRLMCCLGYESPDETSEEMTETAQDENASVVEEFSEASFNAKAHQEVIEESSRQSIEPIKPKSLQPEAAGIKQYETSKAIPPSDVVSSDTSQKTETAKEEQAGQRTGQRHKKRKKWRWRKFPKK